MQEVDAHSGTSHLLEPTNRSIVGRVMRNSGGWCRSDQISWVNNVGNRDFPRNDGIDGTKNCEIGTPSATVLHCCTSKDWPALAQRPWKASFGLVRETLFLFAI